MGTHLSRRSGACLTFVGRTHSPQCGLLTHPLGTVGRKPSPPAGRAGAQMAETGSAGPSRVARGSEHHASLRAAGRTCASRERVEAGAGSVFCLHHVVREPSASRCRARRAAPGTLGSGPQSRSCRREEPAWRGPPARRPGPSSLLLCTRVALVGSWVCGGNHTDPPGGLVITGSSPRPRH